MVNVLLESVGHVDISGKETLALERHYFKKYAVASAYNRFGLCIANLRLSGLSQARAPVVRLEPETGRVSADQISGRNSFPLYHRRHRIQPLNNKTKSVV
ncbi:hypothetical protein PoB_000207800 [Plakobranchus ocellatus]|uniref:Uncharacterized protein n=1 Tax=Plakobranchus ocellatus TaxID=259542 RepID=A0AAV3XYY0_9GAST|nr:hypothetical protein PoB_000207800 [Plakobranchus ocellatus]